MMSTPFDSLDAFAAAVEALPPDDADVVRHRFVAERVDMGKAKAKEHLRLEARPDGPAYRGYLWDFLAGSEVITEDQIWRRVEAVPHLLAMWDLHSKDRVWTPNHFKFPKGTVLRAGPATLRRGLEYLPEDLYLFDDSCSWAGALTHEWIDDVRFCLWAGEGDDWSREGSRGARWTRGFGVPSRERVVGGDRLPSPRGRARHRRGEDHGGYRGLAAAEHRYAASAASASCTAVRSPWPLNGFCSKASPWPSSP
jgi:hypothetical protein